LVRIPPDPTPDATSFEDAAESSVEERRFSAPPRNHRSQGIKAVR